MLLIAITLQIENVILDLSVQINAHKISVASGVATTVKYRKTYADYEDFARNTDFKHQTTVYDSNVIYSN